jgi:uncharacterized protein YjiS (DUF1127 family)
MPEICCPSIAFDTAQNRNHRRTPLDASSPTRLVDLIFTWHQRRRSRYNLMGLPDAMLKDIGLSRSDAEQEWEKPFWRG